MADVDLNQMLDGASADVKASLQLIELVNEMIDASKSSALEKVDAEFDDILAVLEDRERELVVNAKGISSAKLDRMITHAEKLKRNLKRVDSTQEAFRAEQAAEVMHKKMSTQTAQVVRTDDPLFFPRDLDRSDMRVMQHGTIDSQKGVLLSTMFEAATEHPGCERFFGATLKQIETMDADEESGLVTADDIELLVVMLDEFKTSEVHTQACMAMCNVSVQNPKLSEEFGARGGVELLLGWLDDTSRPAVVTATCLLIGVMSQYGDNCNRLLSNGVVPKIMEAIGALAEDMTVLENAFFALSCLCKGSPGGKTAAAEAGAIKVAIEGLTEHGSNKKAVNYVAKVSRFLFYVGDNCTDNETIMMSLGVGKPLCTCIQTFYKHSAVVMSCCSVIQMLLEFDPATDPDGATRAKESLKVFIDAGIFASILACLPENTSNMIMNQTIIAIVASLATYGTTSNVNTAGVCAGKNMNHILDAMTTHARSLPLAMSGCQMILKMIGLAKDYLVSIIHCGGIKAILHALSAFSHDTKLCALACQTLETLARLSSDAKTIIGSEGGMAVILRISQNQGADEVVVPACTTLTHMCTAHVPNKASAAGNGSVKGLCALLRSCGNSPAQALAVTTALSVVCTGNVSNCRKFQDFKGGESAAALAAAPAGKDAKVSKMLGEMSKLAKAKCTEPTGALGQCVFKYLTELGGKLPDSVDASSLTRQIKKQEVIKFTAAGKDPSKVSKYRLICLDEFDIVVYGGEDAHSDEQFTKVIKVYPMGKIKGVRIVPDFKAAFFVEMAGDEVGTFVCDSEEESKEWVAAIHKEIPGISGTDVVQTVEGKPDKRFVSWCADVMLIYNNDDLESDLLQVIPGSEMKSTAGDGATCKVVHSTKAAEEEFVFPGKTDLAKTELALSWESWIRQYLLQREAKEQAEQEDRERLDRARMAKLEDARNGVMEGFDDSDDEDEEIVMPEGYSLQSAKELERILTELTVKVHKEETIDEWIGDEIEKEETRARMAAVALERVEHDIEVERNRVTGETVREDPGSFGARLKMFQNI